MSETVNHDSQILTLRKDAPTELRPPRNWRSNVEFVYVGRALTALALKESPFANPFKIGTHGSRDEVIAKYEVMLKERIRLSALYRESVRALHDKRLVCWCAPEPCHADVLLKWARQLQQEREAVEKAKARVRPEGVIASPACPLTNPQSTRQLKKEYEAYIATQCQIAQAKAVKITDEGMFWDWRRRFLKPVLKLTFDDYVRRISRK